MIKGFRPAHFQEGSDVLLGFISSNFSRFLYWSSNLFHSYFDRTSLLTSFLRSPIKNVIKWIHTKNSAHFGNPLSPPPPPPQLQNPQIFTYSSFSFYLMKPGIVFQFSVLIYTLARGSAIIGLGPAHPQKGGVIFLGASVIILAVSSLIFLPFMLSIQPFWVLFRPARSSLFVGFPSRVKIISLYLPVLFTHLKTTIFFSPLFLLREFSTIISREIWIIGLINGQGSDFT